MTDRIFIAHASLDEPLATELKGFLESLFTGADVFLAEDGIRGGAGWFERIRSALASEPVVLALVTQNSIGSPWLYFEAGSGFVGGRAIPVCGGMISLGNLESPFADLHARELSSSEQIAELAWDLAKAWGHTRRPDHELLNRASRSLLAANRAVIDPPELPDGSNEDDSEGEDWEPRDRETELREVAQLALDLDYEAKHWEECMDLFSTNGRSLVKFLVDVYGYSPPEDAEWHHNQDDVLKDELRLLPTEVHRIIVESHWGVWYLPVPDDRVAAAFGLSASEHQQKLMTAVSLLRERRAEALHEFRKQFEFEYREFR